MADKQLNIVVKAQDQASAQISKIGSSIQESFNKVSAASAVALTALVGFSVAGVKNLADVGEHLDNMATTTGSAIGPLSALKATADEMGLSVDTIGGAMTKMNIRLNSFADNSKAATSALGPLKLKMSELKGLSPEEQFLKIGNSIASIEDPALRSAEAMAIFGKSGNELMPFFNGGNASMADMTAHAKELGVYMDKSAVAAARNADAAFDKLQTTFQGVVQQLVIGLAPAITDIVNKIQPVIQSVTDWVSKNPELVLQIGLWAAGLLAAGAALAPVVAAVTALGTAMAFLAANPIVLVIAAIVALIGYMVYLFNTNEGFRTKVIEVWTAVSGFISQTVAVIWAAIDGFLSQVTTAWNEDWGGVRTTFTELWTFLATNVPIWAGAVVQGIKDTFGPVIQFFQDHWTEIQMIWDLALNYLSMAWSIFWEGIKTFFLLAWETLKAAIKFGLAVMKGDWQGAWDAIKNYFIAAWNTMNEFVTNIVNAISKFLTDSWNTVKANVITFCSDITNAWNGLWSGMKQAVDDAWKYIKGIIDAMINSISSAISYMGKLVGINSGGGSAPARGGSWARGGVPSPGTVNLVGEEGPELFIPNQRGTVIPASKSGGTGTVININVSGNTVLSDDGAEQIGDMIFNRLRLQTKL